MRKDGADDCVFGGQNQSCQNMRQCSGCCVECSLRRTLALAAHPNASVVFIQCSWSSDGNATEASFTVEVGGVIRKNPVYTTYNYKQHFQLKIRHVRLAHY